MGLMGTAVDRAHARGEFGQVEQARGFHDRALGLQPLWLNPIEPKWLLTGKAQTTRRTPQPERLTWRLCGRSQARTRWLSCQDALSHTSSTARLPWAAAWVAHQAKKSMVTALTGRPSTKRSQSSSVRCRSASQERASSP